jgi:hypothetical protein
MKTTDTLQSMSMFDLGIVLSRLLAHVSSDSQMLETRSVLHEELGPGRHICPAVATSSLWEAELSGLCFSHSS